MKREDFDYLCYMSDRACIIALRMILFAVCTIYLLRSGGPGGFMAYTAVFGYVFFSFCSLFNKERVGGVKE